MRKKMFSLTAAAVCLAMLAGCGAGGGETAQPYTKEQAQKILDSGIFTYTLDEYDYAMAWDIYGLESAGLSQDQLVDGSLWNSSGADCEQLALLIFSDADGAEAAVGAMETYLQNQIDSNRDYRPAEVPKLEDPFLQQAGESVLLVVSPDTQAVKDLLG